MKIGGWQKLTLLDFPGRTACTAFTVGCNMRCPFCYNTPLVLGGESLADEEEFFAFLKKRAGLLDGVCVTGGEPTLQPDLYGFIERVRSLGYTVKLDTNGTRPEVIGRLLGDGMLDYIAMDIKSSKERYAEACGIPGFDTAPVERSVSLLMEGRVPYEFRTTVSKELHDERTVAAIGEWIRGADAYFIQSYRDTDSQVGGRHMTSFSAGELEKLLGTARRFVPGASLRGVET